MSYAVEFDLEIVHLLHDGVVSSNLGVCVVHEVTSRVVHGHGDYLRLLRQMVQLLGDLLHESVEVASQLGKRAAVQKQKPLRRGATGCARRIRPTSGCFPLGMLEDRNLIAREAQLTDGDGLRGLRRG